MKHISITYRFITLSLAFLLLFTSSGFTIDTHYCGGKIADSSVFGKAKSCKMMGEDTPNSCAVLQKTENHNSFTKTKCCHNKTTIVDVTDELSSSNTEVISHSQLTFFIAFFSSSYHLFFSKEKETNYFSYSPPLIYKDIQVLDQVFII